MQEPSDRALVLRVRRGEEQAFGELVRRYQSSVFNVCYRFMGERHAAEDMAQEAFLRAHQKLEHFDVSRPFGPWLRTLAANLCLNQHQRKRLTSVALDEEFDRPVGARAHGLEERQQQAERDAQVRAAILSLPPHYRAVIELRHFQELSYAEIGQALDLPMSDVKSHLFRARKLLAQRVGSDEPN